MQPKTIAFFLTRPTLGTLAFRLAALGHHVTRATEMGWWAQRLPGEARHANVHHSVIGHWRKFLPETELVILAGDSFDAAAAFATRLPKALAGKLILDLTTSSEESLSHMAATSVLEILEAKIEGARVVKAHCFAGFDAIAEAPSQRSARNLVYVCGNDETAKGEVIELFHQLDWETEDIGKGRAARLLEPLGLLMEPEKPTRMHQPWAWDGELFRIPSAYLAASDLDVTAHYDDGTLASLEFRVGNYTIEIESSEDSGARSIDNMIPRLSKALENDRLPARITIDEGSFDVTLGVRRTSSPELVWLTVGNLFDIHLEALVRKEELIEVLRKALHPTASTRR